jgi:hypothetical protein
MIQIAQPLRATLFAVLFFVAACGDGGTSVTGPSDGGRSRGAVISGRVNGLSARASAADASGTMATSRVTVTVAGTDISTVVDGNGEFTLTGVPPGDVQLRFAGNGVSATVTLTGVQAGDRITVTISLNGNGNSARVDSDRRNRGNDDDEDDDDDDNEVSGAVSGLTGTCPAITFTVRATTIRTNSATRFDDGSCVQIANGTRVEAKGARQPDGSILATKVELDD